MFLISSNRFHLLSPHHMCQAEPMLSSLHILVENPDFTACTETSSCSASPPFLQLTLQSRKATCSSFLQDFLLEHMFSHPFFTGSHVLIYQNLSQKLSPCLATYFFKAPKIPYGLFTCLLDCEFLYCQECDFNLCHHKTYHSPWHIRDNAL